MRLYKFSANRFQQYGLSAVDEPYWGTHADWFNDIQKTCVGEGVDCSGLVHKTWAMKDAQGSIDFFFWKTDEVIPPNGSYSAAGFYSNCASTNACTWICDGGNCPTTSTIFMDAFATLNDPANPNDNHVGLIYEEISNYEDRILEAVDQAGDKDVRIFVHNWRHNIFIQGGAKMVGIGYQGWCREKFNTSSRFAVSHIAQRN